MLCYIAVNLVGCIFILLSQNEIDSLLAALSSGEIDAEEYKDTGEKQIKNYKTKFEDLFSSIAAETEEMKKNSGIL